MQALLRSVTLDDTDETADLLEAYSENNWMTQALRLHKEGDHRSPEFVALAGVVGVTGNCIIAEATTYKQLSNHANYILSLPRMMSLLDQSVRRKTLPLRTCLEAAINYSNNYFKELATITEGAFRSRASTALSYLIIAGRIIFDHIPTPEEQQILPNPSKFFLNHIMQYEGITNRASIVRQAMTILGHDKITSIDELEPEDQFNSYPAAIYAMNLLQAGGFTTKYYRSKEGTQDTIHKTAFIMSTGYLQALECTQNPDKYETILKACEHAQAQTCLELREDQLEDQAGHQTLGTQTQDQNIEAEPQKKPEVISVIDATPDPSLPPPSPPPQIQSLLARPKKEPTQANYNQPRLGSQTVQLRGQHNHYQENEWEPQRNYITHHDTNAHEEDNHNYNSQALENRTINRVTGQNQPRYRPRPRHRSRNRNRSRSHSRPRHHRSHSTGSQIGQHPNHQESAPHCRYERRPMGCREERCPFKHIRGGREERGKSWNLYIQDIKQANR